MADPHGLFHIGKQAARTTEGQARFNELLKVEQSPVYKTEKPLYEKLSKTLNNPNEDFRLLIFDPLMRLSHALIQKHGSNYDKIRRAIEGPAYQSEGMMMLSAIVGWRLPSAPGIAAPGGPAGSLSLILNMVPVLSLKGREYEFKKADVRRNVRHIFWRLLERLTEELAGVDPGDRGHGRYTNMYGRLSHEATQQMTWDEKIAPRVKWKDLSPTMQFSGFKAPPGAKPTALEKAAQSLVEDEADYFADLSSTVGRNAASGVTTTSEAGEGDEMEMSGAETSKNARERDIADYFTAETRPEPQPDPDRNEAQAADAGPGETRGISLRRYELSEEGKKRSSDVDDYFGEGTLAEGVTPLANYGAERLQDREPELPQWQPPQGTTSTSPTTIAELQQAWEELEEEERKETQTQPCSTKFEPEPDLPKFEQQQANVTPRPREQDEGLDLPDPMGLHKRTTGK